MIRDIIYFIASLFVFGLVYWVINIIISLFQNIFIINDSIVLAVYFLWSMVPVIYYIGMARRFFAARKIVTIEKRGEW